MIFSRRAGEIPDSHGDRRVDVLNSLNVRVSVLESHHNDSIDARNAHSKAIDELNHNLHETTSALRDGLSSFNAKFETLMGQFKIGFLIITIGATVFVSLFTAFIVYNKDLDEKYMKHSEAISEQVNSSELDIQDLQNKKVIKASK
jgi:hypothetical protein